MLMPTPTTYAGSAAACNQFLTIACAGSQDGSGAIRAGADGEMKAATPLSAANRFPRECAASLIAFERSIADV